MTEREFLRSVDMEYLLDPRPELHKLQSRNKVTNLTYKGYDKEDGRKDKERDLDGEFCKFSA